MKYDTYLWLFQKPKKKPLNWRNPTSQICNEMRSEGKKRTLELSLIQGFSKIEKLFGGATSNRKSVCIALFLNKLYLHYDVSPLNKVFTTLHRSTQFCVLGSISACKGRYLFGIINISKKFF